MRRRWCDCGGRNGARPSAEDLSRNLIVQLGAVTEDLNRRWYEANTGQVIADVQNSCPASRAQVDGCNARRTRACERRGI